MNAAKQIIETASFKEVTFSNIAKQTKLSRPSIYKYYQYPEEILSNILTEEFTDFNASLAAANPQTPADFLNGLTSEILKRDLMMKLFAINFSIIEDNIRDEPFLAFKAQIFKFMDIIQAQIEGALPNDAGFDNERAKYSLLTTMAAIYPVTHDDGNHVQLMQQLNPRFNKPDYQTLLLDSIAKIFEI